jgi:hypothetical protein
MSQHIELLEIDTKQSRQQQQQQKEKPNLNGAKHRQKLKNDLKE